MPLPNEDNYQNFMQMYGLQCEKIIIHWKVQSHLNTQMVRIIMPCTVVAYTVMQ